MKSSIIITLLLFGMLFGCISSTTSSGSKVQNGTITTGGKITSNGLTISTNTTVTQGGQVVPILPAATSGQEYNALISVTGGSGPYGCYPAPGTTLPGQLVFQTPGCTISGTAPTLSPGTPSAIYPLSFVVKDSSENVSGPMTFNLVVNQPTVQFLFNAGALPNGAVGQQYSYSFCQPPVTSALCGVVNGTTNPSGGQPPYHFTLESGVGFPPMKLTLGPNGVLSGTPNAAGTSNFGVCAVDQLGDQKCASVTLTISGNPPNFIHYDSTSKTWVEHLQPVLHPAIVSDVSQYPDYRLILDGDIYTQNGEGTGAEEFEQSYFVQGGTAPYTLNVSRQPTSLAIANGALQGAVAKGTAPGNYNITICVTDASGLSTCDNTTLPVVKLDVTIDSITCRLSSNQYGGFIANASASGSASTSVNGTHLILDGSTGSFGDDTYISDKHCPNGWNSYCLLGCSAPPVALNTLPTDQNGNIQYDNGVSKPGEYTDTCIPDNPSSGTWSYTFGSVYGLSSETVLINVSEFIGERSGSRNTVWRDATVGCS